ncbi:MAG: type II toxin-antitoxin system Phd/YefM family antitoxin [Myxococcota bacterium]
MKSVGIKVLKNNLSRYLDLVRQGEVVLVTDRDEVIAELRSPSEPMVTRASPWIAFLEAQARRGTLRLAKRKRSRLEPKKTPGIDVQKLLEETRADRL